MTSTSNFRPNHLKTRLVSILVIVLMAPIFSAASFNQASAADYLLNHANSPWATMALSVLGTTSIPTEYLKTITATNAIGYAAPILAITSINQNPKNFGNEDLVAKLKSYHANGQLGDSATLNDDIFGVLALISAGEQLNDTVITDAKNFILGHQNQDGGWGFMVNAASDTNMTAAAITALLAAGVEPNSAAIQNAIVYLQTAQNPDGGFPYDPHSPYGTDSDSSSTAWVIWALNALHINPASWNKSGGNPITYLESNQTSQGYFKYQPAAAEDAFSAVTTAYAVIALSGKTLPIKVITANQPLQNFPFRIEGQNETVCEGQTAGPTALDIVKNASAQCGFTYHIAQTAYGPYLDKINNDQAFGMTGWLYLINNTPPAVGAADYVLKTGDEVLWYFGDFDWKPTRLALTSTEIASNQTAQALVEVYDNGAWQALPDANVYFGVNSATTNAAGQASFNPADGYYKIYAQKPGYIKSNAVLLKVGQPNSAAVSLTADFILGAVQGVATSTPDNTIAFVVEPDNLDFGQIWSGSSQTKTLLIKNTGGVNLQIESIVVGDSVFSDNVFLNDISWRKFKTVVNAGQNQNTTLRLNIPATYGSTPGKKIGSLTLWAAAQ